MESDSPALSYHDQQARHSDVSHHIGYDAENIKGRDTSTIAWVHQEVEELEHEASQLHEESEANHKMRWVPSIEFFVILHVPVNSGSKEGAEDKEQAGMDCQGAAIFKGEVVPAMIT